MISGTETRRCGNLPETAIPTQTGIQTSAFQKYLKEYRKSKLLNSRPRGNDGIGYTDIRKQLPTPTSWNFPHTRLPTKIRKTDKTLIP